MQRAIQAMTVAVLACVAQPALAETSREHFSLEGPEAAGTLTLDDGETVTVELLVEGRRLLLSGRLTGAPLRGVVSPTRGIAGALAQAKPAGSWKAVLRREGPVVELELRRRQVRASDRILSLKGVIELGPRNAENEALIRRFYEAFVGQDGETMASCYAEQIQFSDPLFKDLHGEDAGDMWRMLCKGARPRVIFSGVRADDRFAVASWEIDYMPLFRISDFWVERAKLVHNVVEARFELRDGKIVRHIDEFDLDTWTLQAIRSGPVRLPSIVREQLGRRDSFRRLKHFQAQGD